MPCGRRCAGQRAGFAEVRKAEAGQGQGDCQAGPGREVRVRAWLSAIARLRESHGASWGRVALARPSGNVLVCGGRGRGAHRGVRYVVHCFDCRGCLGRQDERRDHRRVFITALLRYNRQRNLGKAHRSVIAWLRTGHTGFPISNGTCALHRRRNALIARPSASSHALRQTQGTSPPRIIVTRSTRSSPQRHHHL